jgi:DNA-binding LacI/PurR family transcriptional regulator
MKLVKISMRAVAEKAGVSSMTVSRALRNHPSLPESTRRRIQKIADEMGYRPNPMVSTLMAQLRGVRPHGGFATICFVTAYPDPAHWKDLSLNVHAFQGARMRADALGYGVEHFCLTEPGMTDQRANKILHGRGVAGLIIAPLPEPPPQINLAWDWFACAAIGYSMKAPVLHRAVNDQLATVSTACRSLSELGYKRIGLAIQASDDERVNRRWVAGFSAEQFYAPASGRVPILMTSDWQKRTFSKWLHKHRPDAILCLDSSVKNWVEEEGFSVPTEVGVASLHCDGSNIGLSGVAQHYERVGELAVDIVVEQIHKNERGIPKAPKVVMAGGEWIMGNSTISHIRERSARA